MARKSRIKTARWVVLAAAMLAALLAGCNLARVDVPTPTKAFIIPTLTVPPTFTPVPTSAATPTPTTSPEIVLFLGDSIFQGWRTSNLYPAAFNGAHWGDQSGQTLTRYRNRFVGFYYDAAVVLTGINDITGGIGDAELRDNITQLTSELERATEKIVLCAILPVGPNNYGPQVTERIIATNDWLREFAASRGYVFADYYSAFAGPDGYAQPGLLQDGLHPNRSGYDVMAEVLAQALS